MAFADESTRHILWGLPAGRITLATAARVGDAIGYSSGWKRAKSASTAIAPMLIAGGDGEIGDVISVFYAAIVEGFTGGTAGNSLYIADIAGDYSDSPGATTQVCGFMLSETAALIAARVPATAEVSDLPLANTYLMVGNAQGVAAAVAASGDLTLANTGAFTIGSAKVTSAKLHANQRVRIWTGPVWDIDTAAGGAGTLDVIAFVPSLACTITAVRIVYDVETSGTVAGGGVKVGSAAGGEQIVASTALENTKDVGYAKTCTIVSGAVAANQPIFIRFTGVAATAAGAVHVEIEYTIDDPA